MEQLHCSVRQGVHTAGQMVFASATGHKLDQAVCLLHRATRDHASDHVGGGRHSELCSLDRAGSRYEPNDRLFGAIEREQHSA